MDNFELPSLSSETAHDFIAAMMTMDPFHVITGPKHIIGPFFSVECGLILGDVSINFMK